MKPATTIVAIFLMAISIAHLLRLIFQVDIVANGLNIPIWLSILAVLSLLCWLSCCGGRTEK